MNPTILKWRAIYNDPPKYQQLCSSDAVIGTLEKRGGMFLPSWEKRCFILAEGFLYFFSDSPQLHRREFKGAIVIRGAKIQGCRQDIVREREYAFEIIPITNRHPDSSERTPFYICGGTRFEKQKWMDLLFQCAHMRSIAQPSPQPDVVVEVPPALDLVIPKAPPLIEELIKLTFDESHEYSTTELQFLPLDMLIQIFAKSSSVGVRCLSCCCKRFALIGRKPSIAAKKWSWDRKSLIGLSIIINQHGSRITSVDSECSILRTDVGFTSGFWSWKIEVVQLIKSFGLTVGVLHPSLNSRKFYLGDQPGGWSILLPGTPKQGDVYQLALDMTLTVPTLFLFYKDLLRSIQLIEITEEMMMVVPEEDKKKIFPAISTRHPGNTFQTELGIQLEDHLMAQIDQLKQNPLPRWPTYASSLNYKKTEDFISIRDSQK
eukprot:TRINITY_DN876_c1_g1_i11.p1 TRINITY_DN876_c1_g1~~TRINITY_DN876_c1_g1_i11.p1  ORF type:complete len:432 (+),score=87.77 TRINITY_DN876_c1_g1_i11:623-1918(+)